MLGFVIAEEDLQIETSYPFNKVTAVFLLDNYCFRHISWCRLGEVYIEFPELKLTSWKIAFPAINLIAGNVDFSF